MKKEIIIDSINSVSDYLVKSWPLYSFVTSNPLSGLENLPFEEAIKDIRKYVNINGYPSADAFEQAWNRGYIEQNFLDKELEAKELAFTVEQSLQKMKSLEHIENTRSELHDADRNLVKWLTVFMDQGSTEWPMPYREEGFYKAWKKNARNDYNLPKRILIDLLPNDPITVIQNLLESTSENELESILKHHLLSLPGWTGYIKYRMESGNDWQQAHPITLIDYLAVRLTICSHFGEDILKRELAPSKDFNEEDKIKSAWLRAMESTYRKNLSAKITSQDLSLVQAENEKSEAQLVFCIDTRSERIRRAIEQVGKYETFGYAGFFGIAMDYHHPEKNIVSKSCPPILASQFDAKESLRDNQEIVTKKYNFYNTLHKSFNEFRFTLKNNVPASFGYVESSGFFYGVSMIIRTLFPTLAYRISEKVQARKGHSEWINEVALSDKTSSDYNDNDHLTIAQKTNIAKAAFDLTGWKNFAPLVVFAGHGSKTANNPFGSSLDCGACAGNKGRHNARVLADICNDDLVQNKLAEQHGIHIPNETLFIAAEHNTTSNDFEFFDQHIPSNRRDEVNSLKQNLASAQHLANLEQFNLSIANTDQTINESRRRTSDWAETRPEWGLAGNASLIVGARSLTSNLDLEARSFLHSYDWEKDPEGNKLEGILQGPMVVTQWINNHYYFASVDNDTFGSGSKTTHNVTGKFGVVQGNGGDLKSGLPLESLREDDQQLQHFPLRLSVFINAPQSRVESIIAKHPDTLGRLINNEWIHLSIIDPTLGNEIIDFRNSVQSEVEMHV